MALAYWNLLFMGSSTTRHQLKTGSSFARSDFFREGENLDSHGKSLHFKVWVSVKLTNNIQLWPSELDFKSFLNSWICNLHPTQSNSSNYLSLRLPCRLGGWAWTHGWTKCCCIFWLLPSATFHPEKSQNDFYKMYILMIDFPWFLWR